MFISKFYRSLALTIMLLAALVLGGCGDNSVTSVPAPAASQNPPAIQTTSLPASTTQASGAAASQANPAKGKVTVSSKNFTESILVGEMYAAALENAGLPVERKLNLGTVQITHAALLKGEISLYPEYSGTALLNVLKLPKESNDPKKIYDKVVSEYAKQFNLSVLDPGKFNNTNALVTTKAVADKYKLKTLSDLAPVAKELRLASVASFTGERSATDGLKSLQNTYGGFDFKDVKLFELSLKYKALQSGDVDVAQAFSTDGEISGNGWVLLEDDKNNFPPYQVIPVVRNDILAAYPEIKSILNAIQAKLTTEKISALNWKVDGPEKKEAVDVAKDFLKKEGLIK